jgi:hypothetical protein
LEKERERERYRKIKGRSSLGVGGFVGGPGLDQIRKRHRCAQNMVLALARFEAVKKGARQRQ